jgi:hypothetical protein
VALSFRLPGADNALGAVDVRHDCRQTRSVSIRRTRRGVDDIVIANRVSALARESTGQALRPTDAARFRGAAVPREDGLW